jgi:hypothetical protein
MRTLLLMSIACVASWYMTAFLGIGAEKPAQEKTKELLIGQWEDPKRPGNGWEFDKDGGFTAEISAGVIRSHTQGTYRVLADGSLVVQVRAGDQVARPRRFNVKVTKDRLTFIHLQDDEESYQRAR